MYRQDDTLLRLYRQWLRWYPPTFRGTYGPGMEQTFGERLEDSRGGNGPRPLLLLMGELFSVVLNAILLRIVDSRREIEHTLRSLRKNPGFTTVAILTLALGIGANTAIFSVVNGVLLRPLPFADPDRLVRIFEVEPPGGGCMGFSPPNFMDLRDGVSLLEGVAAYHRTSVALTGDGEPERLEAVRVSAGFFDVLGTPVASGRGFSFDEELADTEPTVLLGQGLWRRRFASDPGVVGEKVVLNGQSHRVVGVAAAIPVLFAQDTDIWLPLELSARDMSVRSRHFLSVLARMKDDVDREQAAEELEALANGLAEAYPESNEGWRMVARPLHRELTGTTRTPLLMLLGAVGLVLLVACANVSSLVLARTEIRGREMAVRAALGAGRGSLLKQLFTESMVLAALGGVAGTGVAWLGTRVLLAGLGGHLPRSAEVTMDGKVLAVTMMMTLGTGLLVGLLPAAQGARRSLRSSLTERGASRAIDPGGSRLRAALVVTEVALSLILTIGAGLLLNSFWRLVHIDPGFRSDNVLTVRVSLPVSRYESPGQRSRFFVELTEMMKRLPGVRSAAAVEGLPLSWYHSTVVTAPGRLQEELGVQRRHVTPGYFGTMGIPVLAGRDISGDDSAEAQRVIVVNETMARRLFPGETVLGSHLTWNGPSDVEDLEIVGVVGDVRAFGLGSDPEPTMYLPNAQIQPADSMSLTLLAAGDPLGLLPMVRQAVWSLDQDLPLHEISTMERIVADALDTHRSWSHLLGLFAAVAVLLAVVGVYGVLSYTVGRRAQELGIRMALGAGRRRLLFLVTSQGMSLVFTGILLGIAGALAFGRVLSGLLFGVSAYDPTTLAAAAVVIVLVAFPACFLPARRAAMVDPMVTLRSD